MWLSILSHREWFKPFPADEEAAQISMNGNPAMFLFLSLKRLQVLFHTHPSTEEHIQRIAGW